MSSGDLGYNARLSDDDELRRAGVEIIDGAVVLYHVTTAGNLAHILRSGALVPKDRIPESERQAVWTNPGEEGNGDRIHLAGALSTAMGIAGHMRFRLSQGGGLYVLTLPVPEVSEELAPDRDTKAQDWRSSLLHPFKTCGYVGDLPVDAAAITGRLIPYPPDDVALDPHSEARVMAELAEREREILASVGVNIYDIPIFEG